MIQKQTIINWPGNYWQHKLLMRLIKAKEFPARLRLFTALKKLFSIDLLLYRTPSGLSLLLDFNDWVQSQIYYHGNYEPLSVSLFKSLAKEADIILDLGAHIGQFALECAQDDINKEKQIFAVEVNPKTFTYLLNNIQLNGFSHVKPVLGALSDGNQILNIGIPAYWNMGNTQIVDDLSALDSFLSASFTIKDLAEKFGLIKIDLIKMDVEGQELNIIQSIFNIGIYPDNILFEFIPETFKDACSVIDLLQANGYQIKDVLGNLYQDGDTIIEQNLHAIKLK